MTVGLPVRVPNRATPRRWSRRHRGLRLPRHRATTRNLTAIYPWQAEGGSGGRGVYLGSNHLSGGGAFCFDPFEAYTAGVVTNPNMLVVGQVGRGKTAVVKQFLFRAVGCLRSPDGSPRQAIVYDPKGEYGSLAEALDLDLVRLAPGGGTRINPLDAPPGLSRDDADALLAYRIDLAGSMLSSGLRRDLTQLEESVLGWSLEAMQRSAEPTLNDLAALWLDPPAELAGRALMAADVLVREMSECRLCLGRLLSGKLRGMFDGRSTVRPRWGGRGLVVDLSAVFLDRQALPLAMMCATSWTQQLFTGSGDNRRRYQVFDEAWAVVADERTARSTQAAFKLARAYGVANIAVVHRLSDLGDQADSDSAQSKIAAGILSDTETRALLAQPESEVPFTRSKLGLTATEALLLPQMVRGRVLWKIGGHTAVVQHHLTGAERALSYSDGRLSLTSV